MKYFNSTKISTIAESELIHNTAETTKNMNNEKDIESKGKCHSIMLILFIK